jgi:ABC-type branched-subunit amino acid transport system substrate-binding protein
MRVSLVRPAAVLLLLAGLLAGCGSSSGGGSGGASSGGSGPLVIGALNPFSGANSAYGILEISGCAPAVRLIDAAGGVLGHSVKCQVFDTRGDPADAVLAAHQMIASTSNLVGVLGPSSNEDSATLPIVNQAHIPMFANAGDTAYRQGHYDYFWRTLPADSTEGYAMAQWAHQQGFTRGAAIFTNDVAAQGNVPGITAGFRKLGGQIVINEQLAPGQTSYQTEVERMLATHPQVIFTETDPRTAGVLFGELKQLGGLRPVITSAMGVDPNYIKAILQAIGKADATKYITTVTPYAATSGPAWSPFNTALLASGSQVTNPAQYSSNSYSMVAYDDANIMALAMLAAKSTNPSVYNNFISKVTTAGSGAVNVNDFAAGKAALTAGKTINYVGPTGQVVFDSTHNSPGVFAAFQPTGNTSVLTLIPTASIAALVK